MSHEGHTKFLEDRLEMVQESLKQIPRIDDMRDDLKDDLLEHVMSYVQGYEDAGVEYPILELVMDWFVERTANSMSGKDLNNMAEEYEKKEMPAHYRYLVE